MAEAGTEQKTVRARLEEAVKLHQQGDLGGAEQIYAEILDEDPKSSDAWHLMGLVQMSNGRSDVAATFIERAIALRPAQATFHHNYGNVLAQLGRFDEADANLREAIKLKPDYVDAYYNLTAQKKYAESDPLLDQVLELIADGERTENDLCLLHFAAGKLCDDMGRFDDAFDHFEKGNQAKAVDHNPVSTQAFFDKTLGVFTPEFFLKHTDTGIDTTLPVFVIGMPRSGTSLVEQIIASHPMAYGAGELQSMRQIAHRLSMHTKSSLPYPDCMPEVDRETYDGYGKSYTDSLAKKSPKAIRIVDKMPYNFLYVGLIHLMMPSARIIHCRRNALDVCTSIFNQNFTTGNEYAFDLSSIGAYYKNYESVMAHWEKVLPGKVISIDYEALIDDPDRISQQIITAAGLPWHQDCANFQNAETSVRTASRWQVRQPVYKTSQNRWKRYERHLGPLFTALGRTA